MLRRLAQRRELMLHLVLPLALCLSALVVWRASYEAFTTTTDSPNNQWTAGQLSLVNDTTGTFATTGALMFNPGAVVPGDTGTWCVNVKNTSTSASTSTNPIKFFAPLPATLASNTLAQNLTFSVVESTSALTGLGSGSCSGFTAGNTVYSGPLSALPASYTTATAPAGTGVLNTNTVKGYKLTWTMPTTTPNSVAGVTLTGVDLAWGFQIGS